MWCNILLIMTCAHFLNTFVDGSSEELFRSNLSPIVQKSDKQTKKSFIWRIEGDPPSYLFGTIHVPYIKVWDAIPKNVMEAFDSTHQLYLELDMTPKTISDLSSCQMLPKCQTVSDILPPKLYARLQSYLDYLKNKIASWLVRDQKMEGYSADVVFNAVFKDWEKKRPIWTLINMAETTKHSIIRKPYPVLDKYLSQLAKNQSKSVNGIENVNEYCGMFGNLNTSQVVFIANKALDGKNHELLRMRTKGINKLILDYRSGALSPPFSFRSLGLVGQTSESTRIHQLSLTVDNCSTNPSIEHEEDIQMMQYVASYLHKSIIINRNKIMAKRVVEILKLNPNNSFFFAFGVYHLIGEDSVVGILRQARLKVKRLSPEEMIIDSQKRIQDAASSSNIISIKCMHGFSMLWAMRIDFNVYNML